MTSLLRGRVGVSQKVTKSDWGGGGFGLFSKPKVTSSTVGHFLGQRGGKPKSDQKVCFGKSDLL